MPQAEYSTKNVIILNGTGVKTREKHVNLQLQLHSLHATLSWIHGANQAMFEILQVDIYRENILGPREEILKAKREAEFYKFNSSWRGKGQRLRVRHMSIDHHYMYM